MPFSKWPNNFRAEFNMATYELFKDKLFTTIDSMSSNQNTLLKYTVDNNTDQKNMVVFQTKNVINKKVYSCPIGQK
jgi:hypothetical protein